MRVVRFYVSCLLLLSSSSPPPLLLLVVLLVLLVQLRPAIHSVLCRTSTTTIHAQCSLPDLNHDHPRPVFPAGPQPRPSTPSVPCRTSTASIPAQCSLPDLNHDHPRPVFPAGPQPRVSTPKDMPHRVPEDMPDRMLEDMPDRMPEGMPDRMPDRMSARMPEDMPDRMPDRMPENMSDRMPEDLPVTKCINVMVGITRSKVIFTLEKSRGSSGGCRAATRSRAEQRHTIGQKARSRSSRHVLASYQEGINKGICEKRTSNLVCRQSC